MSSEDGNVLVSDCSERQIRALDRVAERATATVTLRDGTVVHSLAGFRVQAGNQALEFLRGLYVDSPNRSRLQVLPWIRGCRNTDELSAAVLAKLRQVVALVGLRSFPDFEIRCPKGYCETVPSDIWELTATSEPDLAELSPFSLQEYWQFFGKDAEVENMSLARFAAVVLYEPTGETLSVWMEPSARLPERIKFTSMRLRVFIEERPAAAGVYIVGAQEQFEACGNCNTPLCELRCGRCKVQRYCSVECQREGWKTHKLNCQVSAS